MTAQLIKLKQTRVRRRTGTWACLIEPTTTLGGERRRLFERVPVVNGGNRGEAREPWRER